MRKLQLFVLILGISGGLLTVLWLMGTCSSVLKIRTIIREIKKIKKILFVAQKKVGNRWGLTKERAAKWKMDNGKWKKRTEDVAV